jgi:hypothetical protein
VFASLLIAFSAHTPDTLAIPLADLNVALVLLLILLWLAIDPSGEPPIPLLANSPRRVNTDIVPPIPDLEGKSVQLTLQSCHYFFAGDRDIIAVFFTFVPFPHSTSINALPHPLTTPKLLTKLRKLKVKKTLLVTRVFI